MMKKGLFLAVFFLLCFIIAPGLFAGGAKEEQKAKVVELEWWYGSWLEENGASPRMIKEFQEKHPDIKINGVPVAWSGMYEKLLSSLVAKSGPDLMNFTVSWSTSLVRTNGFSDVTSHIDKIGRDKFYEAALLAAKSGGKDFAYPYRTGVYAFFVNDAMIQEAGLSGAPKTLDEFAQFGVKLTRDTNKDGLIDIYGAALPLNRKDRTVAGSVFRWVLNAYDADYISADATKATLNTEGAKKSYSYYRDLFKTKVLPPDTLDLDNDDTRRRFEEAKVAMTLTGPWAIPSIAKKTPDMKYSIHLLPGPKPDIPGKYELGGWDIAITSWSQKKEAAQKFIEYFLLPENNAYFTDALPAIKKAADAQRFQDPKMQVYLKQVAVGSRALIPSPLAPAIEEAAVVGHHRIFLGEDVDKVLAEVNKEIQAMLDKK